MLEIANVSFGYGKKNVLENINFNIDQYGIYGLIGSNGAGKSTLLELIAGMKGNRFTGSIKLNKIDQGLDYLDYKKKIGILFQEEQLEKKLTVKETIEFYRHLYSEESELYKTEQLIEMFDLTKQRNVYIKNLSGGLRQRVKIAITCINKPDLILLDEPTTGLDPKYRKEFWDSLSKIVEDNKTTILLSSHDMIELERYCNRILHLQSRKMIYFGLVDELVEENECDSLEEYYLKTEGESK